MKRIFTSFTEPGQGAVYRDLSACADAAVLESSSSSEEGACGACIGTDAVGVISPPGCSEFPVTDNDYGNLPTFYAGSIEIDTFGYDARWEDLDNPLAPDDLNCPIPAQNLDYVDLWTRIEEGSSSALEGLQDDVLQDDCYCFGEGIEQPTLAIGRPQFPRVDPLPFFAFPNVQASNLTVRELNPDGPGLEGDCCPTDQDLPEHIFAEIVGGEIRLTRHEKPPVPEVYRADDTDEGFQVVAGYPKKCCLLDDCAPSGEERYVMRDLHFPRWPGPNSLTQGRDIRNPYEEVEVDREEPLGIIPVVVDLGCHTDGKLYVYYANLVIHDGHVAGLQWHVEPPRSEVVIRPMDEEPLAPETLDLNKDYQDVLVFDPFTPIVDQGEDQPWCNETCNEAAVAMGKSDEACAPACPAEALLCVGAESQFISEDFGDTPDAAEFAAFLKAITVDAPANCADSDTVDAYWLCYTVLDEATQTYKAAVTFCCVP